MLNMLQFYTFIVEHYLIVKWLFVYVHKVCGCTACDQSRYQLHSLLLYWVMRGISHLNVT